jgi:hypothetical protein
MYYPQSAEAIAKYLESGEYLISRIQSLAGLKHLNSIENLYLSNNLY